MTTSFHNWILYHTVGKGPLDQNQDLVQLWQSKDTYYRACYFDFFSGNIIVQNNQSIQYRYWKRDGTNHPEQVSCDMRTFAWRMWPSFRKFQLAELGNETCTPFEADDNITNSTLLRTHRKGCLRRKICTQSNCNNQQSFLIAQSWKSSHE